MNRDGRKLQLEAYSLISAGQLQIRAEYLNSRPTPIHAMGQLDNTSLEQMIEAILEAEFNPDGSRRLEEGALAQGPVQVTAGR